MVSNTDNNTNGGTAITGETNSNYTLHQPLQGTIYYYCVITLSSGGCSAIKSNTAAATILSNSNNGATFSYSKSFVVSTSPPSLIILVDREILPPMVSNTTNTILVDLLGNKLHIYNACFTAPALLLLC
jgi:hypothetical protein